MAGALNALDVGSVVNNTEGYVVACCSRFADFVDRPKEDVVGRRGREFMIGEDVDSTLRFLSALWITGESFTITSRLIKPSGESRLFESHVSRLDGPYGPMSLAIVRPFKCKIRATEPDPLIASLKAAYVTDMSSQLASFAANAFMPVTADLLRSAGEVAAHEAG